jgi:antitoxin VapB
MKIVSEHGLYGPETALPLRERLRPLQARIAAWPATGDEADKALYDDLFDNIGVAPPTS